MSLPHPAHSNFWRERILTDDELVETLALAQAYVDERRAKLDRDRATIKAFLEALPAIGYSRHSPEYKYVVHRIVPKPSMLSFVYDIRRAQDDLIRKAGEERRKAELAKVDEDRRKEALAKLVDDAKSLGIDPIAHFGDERGLRQAVRDAKEAKFEDVLATAPYYVLASFYGHCLRGDWSDGRDSYGREELVGLAIPDEDSERFALSELAKDLRQTAIDWDGGDGRDFRWAYQELDALLSEEDAQTLAFLNDTRFELRYS